MFLRRRNVWERVQRNSVECTSARFLFFSEKRFRSLLVVERDCRKEISFLRFGRRDSGGLAGERRGSDHARARKDRPLVRNASVNAIVGPPIRDCQVRLAVSHPPDLG
jgi:hypothetical protein